MEPEEKSQAGTNLAIVILVLVIVVVGVKLLMSSTPVGAPGTEAIATSTATEVEATTSAPTMHAEGEDASGTSEAASAEQGAMSAVSASPVGSGQVAFSVSSPVAVTVREIFVHNPYHESDASEGWIQIYDGYKAVPAASVTFTSICSDPTNSASLAPS